MKKLAHRLFRQYFEIVAFGAGLLALALMNPETANGPGFCLFERLGVPYCPGDGLGHSIAYLFRGEIYNALQANVLGPVTVIILTGRIAHLWRKNIKTTSNLEIASHGKDD